MIDWQFLQGLAAQDTAPPSSGLQNMMPMFLVMGLAFYFIFLRPQKRDQAKRQKMLDQLKKGDKVVTVGGLHGWVTDLNKDEKTISIRVDTKTEVKLNRSAVSSVARGDDADEAKSA